jgi:hypothetical protein
LIGIKAEYASRALIVGAPDNRQKARARFEELDVNKLAIPHNAMIFVGVNPLTHEQGPTGPASPSRAPKVFATAASRGPTGTV